MLDLMTIKFMASYHTKPIYVFGLFGFSSFLISIVAGVWAVMRKLGGESFIRNPLLVVAIVMFAVGVQFILMGLLAEMLVRTYHESQAKTVYTVRGSASGHGIRHDYKTPPAPRERPQHRLAREARPGVNCLRRDSPPTARLLYLGRAMQEKKKK